METDKDFVANDQIVSKNPRLDLFRLTEENINATVEENSLSNLTYLTANLAETVQAEVQHSDIHPVAALDQAPLKSSTTGDNLTARGDKTPPQDILSAEARNYVNSRFCNDVILVENSEENSVEASEEGDVTIEGNSPSNDKVVEAQSDKQKKENETSEVDSKTVSQQTRPSENLSDANNEEPLKTGDEKYDKINEVNNDLIGASIFEEPHQEVERIDLSQSDLDFTGKNVDLPKSVVT